MKFVRAALFVAFVSVLHSHGVEAKQSTVTTGARAPTTAPLGQQLYMNTAGCGQCHEPENAYGRMWLGEHAK